MRYKDYSFNDNYIIYENGKIFSKKRGIFLKPSLDKKGYQIVVLTIEGKQVTKRVHRIVAEHFIPNPENKPQVNHIDKNKENNDVSNLEWVTASENMLHALKDKPKTPKKNYRHKIRRTVEKNITQVCNRFCVTIKGNYLGIYKTIEEAREARRKFMEKDTNNLL